MIVKQGKHDEVVTFTDIQTSLCHHDILRLMFLNSSLRYFQLRLKVRQNNKLSFFHQQHEKGFT